jgi:hypothetical protein
VRALRVQPLRPLNEKSLDNRRDDRVEGATALPRHVPNLREARVGGGLSSLSTSSHDRQADPPFAVHSLGGEPKALVGGKRGEVDRSLGVGGQHDQRVAGSEARELAAGVEEGERAGEPAGVEGSYDQGMIAAFLESGEPQRLFTAQLVVV